MKNLKESKLHCVLGTPEEGGVAQIRFADAVNADSTRWFVSEFDWLVNYVKPSKIEILINSEGGSVLRGMNAFSAIIGTEIETEAIVEGMAASMASTFLAAADKASARDYAIIMIHNPFLNSDNESPLVKAFQGQLKTIYKKRWGLSESEITAIMDGKDGEDGTYLTAQKAKKLGIVSNVISTPKQDKGKVMAALKESGLDKVMDVYNELLDGESKPFDEKSTTFNQQQQAEVKSEINKNLSNMNKELVVATIGLKEGASEGEVIAKLNDLSKVEGDLNIKVSGLEDTNAQLVIDKSNLEVKMDGVKAELKTKETELESVKAELVAEKEKVAGFETKEAEKEKAGRVAYVEAAVKDQKIKEEDKDKWLVHAEINFEMVQDVLGSMEKPVVISEEVDEAAKIKAAKEAEAKAKEEGKGEMKNFDSTN